MAISSLAINVFICSVISCLGVSSRGYLVSSDDAFVCSEIPYSEVKRVLLEIWFRSHGKKNITVGGGGGGTCAKTSFRAGMELKKVHKQARDEIALGILPQYGIMQAPL